MAKNWKKKVDVIVPAQPKNNLYLEFKQINLDQRLELIKPSIKVILERANAENDYERKVNKQSVTNISEK